jgi:hypothetical protein
MSFAGCFTSVLRLGEKIITIISKFGKKKFTIISKFNHKNSRFFETDMPLLSIEHFFKN